MLFVCIACIQAAGTSNGQYLQSSANKITECAVALADFQVISANLALTKDIFGLVVVDDRRSACHAHLACSKLEDDCGRTTSGVQSCCCEIIHGEIWNTIKKINIGQFDITVFVFIDLHLYIFPFLLTF